jgi:ABC-2 type transport system permease protein
MDANKIFLVLSREFKIRVKKKSFILTTILTPVFIASMVVIPMLIASKGSDAKGIKILVADSSGVCSPYFKNTDEYTFIFDDKADIEKIKKNFAKEGVSALVVISKPDSALNVTASAMSDKQLNISAKETIQRSVQNAVEALKQKKYNIENLNGILQDIRKKIELKTYVLSEEGKEKLGMVEINMGISYLLSFMSYMFIFMFGSMVMRGVIEEKTTRIVEVIVSSVKPFDLMLGKILGVGSVAVLQFVIWILLSVGIFVGIQHAFGVENIAASANIAGQINPAAVQMASAAGHSPMAEILTALAGVNWVLIISAFLMYFIFGYLLYASMFAAVGSAVDNEADTQQLVLPVTLPLIVGLFIMIHTFQFPDSSLSFWGSMIPFTSPMVMMARVSYGVPIWQLATSVLLLILTFLGMTLVSAKIYRVGILSYGKKGSWKEIMKWLKY